MESSGASFFVGMILISLRHVFDEVDGLSSQLFVALLAELSMKCFENGGGVTVIEMIDQERDDFVGDARIRGLSAPCVNARHTS